jgi:hypothetical protein
MASKGWSEDEIAGVYRITPSEVRRILNRPPPPPPRTRKPPRPAPWRDEWKQSTDWRYLDDVGPDGSVEVLADPAAGPELVDQAGAVAEIAAEMVNPPAGSTWFDGEEPREPRKITSEVLEEALWLHSKGVSWPEIARKYRVHRQTLYFARRRARG